MTIQEQKFGIEVEMTGITREQAAKVIAKCLNSSYNHRGGHYSEYHVKDDTDRKWTIMLDSSLNEQRKADGVKVIAGSDYSIELVTPICTYDDIETIQDMVRKLRDVGGFCNSSCGTHIHINSTPFEPYQIKNLVNIIAAKEDMFYKALQVDHRRERYYCKKVDKNFLDNLNKIKPTSREQIKELWYSNSREGESSRYHESRYHCLNLHSTFQKNTFEFRAFNGSLHAGKLKAYLQLCLGVTAQAYNQKYASPTPTKSTNEKYTFRTWLLRLGMIGDEFKTARKHLLDHLDGNIAWKTPEQAELQKQRLREKALKESTVEVQEIQEVQEIEEVDEEPRMEMSM